MRTADTICVASGYYWIRVQESYSEVVYTTGILEQQSWTIYKGTPEECIEYIQKARKLAEKQGYKMCGEE